MDTEEFRKWSKAAADWSADYRATIAELPVRSQLAPGDVLKRLPQNPPTHGEDFANIFADFKKMVPDGITHWQHPRFFAYFPSNASLPSVIAEQLIAALSPQCMLWQTSPVATEMEMRMLEWLAQMCGLPADWHGSIQDSASNATLAAVLTARETALDWTGHRDGLANKPQLRFYTSIHCHSSANKAIWLAGIGEVNLVVVPCRDDGSMDPAALRTAIASDRAAGYLPTGLFAIVGSTSIGISDDLRAIGEICRTEKLYAHVDAAWAGSATLCPEHRHLLDGLELFDSYVFNPHKWLGTNFDLSAHYVREPEKLQRTLATHPAYLKTQHASSMPDFSNWSLPLGRRFRALKLWFVIRCYGIEGLQTIIRNHINWAQQAAAEFAAQPDFELVAGPNLALFVFRHTPAGLPAAQLNTHNAAMLDAINAAGFTYLTQTDVDGTYALRFQVGHTDTTLEHVLDSVKHIIKLAKQVTDS